MHAITASFWFDLICRAASGTVHHERRHRCQEETRASYGCPQASQAYWATTDEEYIKFSSRLILDRTGVIYEKTIERYAQAWARLYPGQPVPFTDDGKPVDFCLDPYHPAPRVPWLGDIPGPASRTLPPPPVASSSGAVHQQPLASSSGAFHPTSPTASSWDVTHPPVNPAPASSSSSSAQSPVDAEVAYLQSHSFEMQLDNDFPRLMGLFPGFEPYCDRGFSILRAFFILCPQYQLIEDTDRSTYHTKEEIEDLEYQAINTAAPGFIKKLGKKGKDDKVKCVYHSWVSLKFENWVNIN